LATSQVLHGPEKMKDAIHLRFTDYRRRAQMLAQEILRSGRPGEFDEQALPTYTHPSPLMRWRRLARVVRHFDRTVSPAARVLDAVASACSCWLPAATP
jgi:hypothetical protein